MFGLKENVIIGKLIPAGTGYYQNKQREEAAEVEGNGQDDIELDIEGIFDQAAESDTHEEAEELDIQDAESDELELT